MNESLLSLEEIENENLRMRLEDDSLVLLKNYPKVISRKRLLEMMGKDSLPNSTISKDILENRNTRDIPEEIAIESGITMKRTSLKYLPTDETFYSSSIVEENMATELFYATPLLILHRSLDQKWYYIQCHFYRGWIAKDDVLIISEQDRLLFEEPEKFIVITKPLIPFYNTLLDLGLKLPVLGIHESYYEIFVPTKEGITIKSIPNSICNLGYLPYKKDSIITIAKECLGIPYEWGGKNNGLDCSLFIYCLFKVFGFQFPRDAKNQENVVGFQKIILKGKTEIEKREMLETISYPAILHKKGHVLLAISSTEVIHAYGDAKKVILSTIESSFGTNLYPFLTTISCMFKS